MTLSAEALAHGAKLTDEQVLYALQSPKTNRELAAELGISESACQRMRCGGSYQWVHPEVPRLPGRQMREGPRCSECVHYSDDRCSMGFPEFKHRNLRAAAVCAAFTTEPIRFPWQTAK